MTVKVKSVTEHISVNWADLEEFQLEFENVKAGIPLDAYDISVCANEGTLSISYYRPMTAEEIEIEKQRDARDYKRRYEQYKKLKKEFEGAVVKYESKV